MEFQEIKSEILRRAQEQDACKPQYERAESVENSEGLLQVVRDNFGWCWSSKVIDADLLLEFGEELLWANRIYVRGNHNIELHETASIFLCGSSQATVETWGSSQATVETRESSQATVKTWESSQATVKTWESSQATVKTRESSQATVKTRESSQATVETRESSIIRDLTAMKVYVPKGAFEIVIYEEM